MSEKLEDLLSGAAQSVGRKRPVVSRDLLERLQLLAGLLREAPAEPSGARLLWRNQRGEACAMALTRPVVIGRDSTCDIVLVGARISRRHCVVRLGAGGPEVEDIGSSTGTRVNGEETHSRILHEGDVIEIGGVAFACIC